MIDLMDNPASELLVSGGDSRITVQGENQLNSYGCSPFPRYSIAYASCTSSTITGAAYAFAESYLHRINKLASVPDADPKLFEREFERVRNKIREFYEVPADVDIVLGSSGTDLELVALAASLGTGRPVHNIVLGANEVGSGINDAARGRYFSDLTPRGGVVRAGETIPGFDPERLSFHDIELRHANGAVRSEVDIIQEYTDQIERAIAQGRTVLLHMIHRSKTGLIMPSFRNLKKLITKYGEAIDVVVDACQGRISIRMVNEYLKLGAAVLFTGSKFYSGPPFSGALLLPSPLADRIKREPKARPGLADFFTRAELPAAWTVFDGVAREEVNMGLLLRWIVAIYEMNKVFLVPNKRIEFVINTFNTAARRMIEQSPFLEEAKLSTISREDLHPENTRSPFEINSILTFTIKGRNRFLDNDDAKLINKAMYSDLSAHLATDDPIAAIPMQLGQPVKVTYNASEGRWTASLRIALSSNHIGELGLLDDEIIRMRFESDFDRIHEKLTFVIEHLDALKKNINF